MQTEKSLWWMIADFPVNKKIYIIDFQVVEWNKICMNFLFGFRITKNKKLLKLPTVKLKWSYWKQKHKTVKTYFRLLLFKKRM